MDASLKEAAVLGRAGRFEEAAAIYRQVLSSMPEHAEATHFLGICLARLAGPAEGLPLLERSVELAPGNPDFRRNLGMMLAEAGDLAAAEAHFLELVARHARDAAAHNCLGMTRQRLGRFDEAIASYREALRLAPRDPAAANNLGFCLIERGDAEGAIQWLRRALAAAPDNAMAHNNLGNAQRMRGELDAAAKSYRRAVALAPKFAQAHYNLALALRALGEAVPALQSVRTALHHAPTEGSAWQLFAELLVSMRFGAWDPGLAAECGQLLSQTEVDVQEAALALLSLVRTGPRGRLFLLLLEHVLVPDETFEREMTVLRRAQLFSAESLELVCALAHQCFLNEYVWPADPEELAALDRLPITTPLGFALAAMYRRPAGAAKPQGGSEALDRLWRRVVEEPEAEARIAVPILGAAEDAVSRIVQQQYEANPYPRWHRAPIVGPFVLPRMLRSLFPHLEPAKLAAPEAPDILVAGCGTGRHAAISAQMQPHARLLAVDLSRASLAHAMRRTRELGLTNLRFAQADILQLGALEERFDLIECSGVLHHMADPLAGWRVLVGLLRPGGFMKLGLYSAAARRHIDAARATVAGLEVRAARQRLLALAPGDPAREVVKLHDFYSASGARDLLLHVQEHHFTVPGLARAIDALGLEFLGFELDEGTLPAFRKRFPRDRTATSLEHWDAFEREHPDTFASMYQFWVARR